MQEDRRLLPITDKPPAPIIEEEVAPTEPATTEPPATEEAPPPGKPLLSAISYEGLLSVPGMSGQIAKRISESPPMSALELGAILIELESVPSARQRLLENILERFAIG